MLINNIDIKYNTTAINYKGKNVLPKESNLYKSALKTASNDVVEYLGNQTNKIQNSYTNFLSNWINGQNKALKTILSAPVIVAFFSKDKSEKIVVNQESNTVSLQTKEAKNIFYKNGSWSEEVSNLEDSLMQIVNNNVENVEEKAKLMFLLSDVYLNKLLSEKDSSEANIVRNLHNLFECIVNRYNVPEIIEIHQKFIDSNLENKTDSELKKDGWKWYYDDGRHYTLDNDVECYDVLDTYQNRYILRKYERKIEPKYSIERPQETFSSPTIHIYDSQNNNYEHFSFSSFGVSYNYIKARIKGFGDIECSYSHNDKIHCYDITRDGEETSRKYKFDPKTKQIVK